MPKEFSIRGSVGYQQGATEGPGGKAELSRNTFKGTIYKKLSDHAVGIGITHHRSLELLCDFENECDNTFKFENATGPHVEYNYRLRVNDDIATTFNIRYTNINYKLRGADKGHDASHFDISIGFMTF